MGVMAILTGVSAPAWADPILSIAVGTGRPSDHGDGGPALAARRDVPFDVAVDERGDVCLPDRFSHRNREVDHVAGRIVTVAGGGGAGDSGDGDGGPATAARLDRPRGVAVAADGPFRIGDTPDHRIRRVAPGR